MSENKTKIFKTLRTIGLIVILLVTIIYPPLKTQAADLTAISDTMSRMKAETASDHTIVFTTPSGRLTNGDTITITFPTGFTIGTVDDTDIDLTATTPGDIPLAATADATHWGASFTGQVLTLTHATDTDFKDIVATDTVTVEIGLNATGGNAQITNQTVVQNTADQVIDIDGNNSFDTGSLAVEIVTDDQIVYTATVDPSINVVFSAVASSFSTITTSAVAVDDTNIDLQISTNANGGMTVKVYDTGGGTGKPGLLLSGGSGDADIIGSTDNSYTFGPTVLAANTEGYGIYAQNPAGGSGDTIDLDPDYDYGATDVGGLKVGADNAEIIASCDDPINQRVVRIQAEAAIDGLTKPGTYNDTVTVIVTGNF